MRTASISEIEDQTEKFNVYFIKVQLFISIIIMSLCNFPAISALLFVGFLYFCKYALLMDSLSLFLYWHPFTLELATLLEDISYLDYDMLCGLIKQGGENPCWGIITRISRPPGIHPWQALREPYSRGEACSIL